VSFWQQNAEQVWPRNGTAPTKDYYPRSAPFYAPQRIAPSQENPSSVAPGGGYRATPLYVDVQPSFGEWDGLGGDLMRVSQADTYDTSMNPWPAAGTSSESNAAVGVMQMMRLQPTTSAHPGLSFATGGGPTMMFHAPPVFSAQSQPIYAVGL